METENLQKPTLALVINNERRAIKPVRAEPATSMVLGTGASLLQPAGMDLDEHTWPLGGDWY